MQGRRLALEFAGARGRGIVRGVVVILMMLVCLALRL
jgi:hypothetical protein